MTTPADAKRAQLLADLGARNAAALAQLHRAAQAISDGEAAYARQLQREAARALRRWRLW